jgi:hypothetical protein
MTIAAGFVHSEGVMLCSDTQFEAGASKTYGTKLGFFNCPGGNIAYAFAGNASFAMSAIQKCEEKLKSTPAGDTICQIEKTLDREYRRVVYGHPDHTSDWTLPYVFLIALQRPGRRCSLFAIEQTAMRSVPDSECIGVGKDFATYLVKPDWSSALASMTEYEALLLAASTLARVKAHVSGCGGTSQFIMMRNDGGLGSMSHSFSGIEERINSYDASTKLCCQT